MSAGTTSGLTSDPGGIVLSAIDTSAGACDNFYQRACGGFLAAAKPDGATPSISMTAQRFDANLESGLNKLLAHDVAGNPELGRLKTFYTSCLAASDAADGLVVKGWLERIDAARSPQDVQTLLRNLATIGVDPFFTYSGQPDRTHWTRYRGEIHNSYLWADQDVVSREFAAAGESSADAARDAAAVAAIVQSLNGKTGDRYDAKSAENPRSLAQIERLAPSFDWARYGALVGAPIDQPINLTSPAFLSAVNQQLETRSMADLRAYLRWSFLFSLRGELPRPYNQAFGNIIPPLRVKLDNPAGRCRDATVRAMGVEFSRQYAEHILGWRAREAARRIAGDIKKAIVASVASDRWLSASARRQTADKLAKTDLKIGFPDQWPAVGQYRVVQGRFLDNVLAARAFEQRRTWSRAGQPRNRSGWEMTVSPWVGDGMAAARLVVPNGFPDAFSNSLIMTAAFLAPPRFDASSPPELNYGTFGAVFAHEFVHVAESHMFGRDGRDAELWSAADIKAAQKKDHCVVLQADNYQPLSKAKISGERQFDENVADYGGVRLAFEALQARMGVRIYQRDASGTSPAQRFFYKYAQNYCTAQTEANLRQSIESDHHGLPTFRVNGSISNLPAFRRAFSCKPHDRMVRSAEERCRVW
ncbi:MAG: M13 family metallopeptidase [Sphingomonas sp.]